MRGRSILALVKACGTLVAIAIRATVLAIRREHPSSATAYIHGIADTLALIAATACALAIYTIGMIIHTAVIGRSPSVFSTTIVTISRVVIATAAIALVIVVVTIVAISSRSTTTKASASILRPDLAI
jgi:hypothetical protein